MRDVTLLSMKNKSVQNCRFVHHAKFHFIMTTLNKLFKIEFERWGGNWKRAENATFASFAYLKTLNSAFKNRNLWRYLAFF